MKATATIVRMARRVNKIMIINCPFQVILLLLQWRHFDENSKKVPFTKLLFLLVIVVLALFFYIFSLEIKVIILVS